MATTDEHNVSKGGAVDRLFIDHPRSLGMSWASHAGGAVKVGFELIGAGCAAIIHALVPGLFTETASRIVTRVHDHIQRRPTANPPDDG